MEDSIELSSQNYQTNYLNNQPNKSSPVNWISVINFLEQEYTKSTIRQKQWFLQKQILNDEILKLKGQIYSHESLNLSLVNKIKLLEISFRRQSLKKIEKNEQNQKGVEITTNLSEIEKYFTKNGWNLDEKPSKSYQSKHQAFLNQIFSQVGININKMQQKCRRLSLNQTPNQLIIPNKAQKLQDFKSLIQSLQKLKIQNKTIIIAHLDTVRGLYIKQNPHLNQSLITSVSQDCLLKTWSIDNKVKNENIQPILSYRQHTGQLFALESGEQIRNFNDYMLFTGGSEEFIKVWYNPHIQQPQSLKCIGFFLNDSNNSEETSSQTHEIIWQMKYKSKKLLTSSSDGNIRLFDVNVQQAESNNYTSSIGFLKEYKQKAYSQNAIEWVGESGFLSSCSNFPKINLWDIETNRVIQKYSYQIQKSKDDKKKDPLYNSLFQTNSLKYMPDNRIILAGCEDKSLRVFSYNQNKIIKKISAGVNQSINCVDIYKSNYIVGGSQDGSLKIWDRRTFKELFDEIVHQIKYDEGILCLKCTDNAIYTGGADGVVKVFKI